MPRFLSLSSWKRYWKAIRNLGVESLGTRQTHTRNTLPTHTHTHTQVFGHHAVSILDGGLPRWKFRGFPTIHGPPPSVAPAHFQSTFDPSLVRTLEQMLDNFSTKDEQVCLSVCTSVFVMSTYCVDVSVLFIFILTAYIVCSL